MDSSIDEKNPVIHNKWLLALAIGLAALLQLPVATADKTATETTALDEFATAEELGLMKGFPPPADKRVNRSNALFGVPYNRWSYLHMRSIYPTANIPNAKQPLVIQKKIDGGIDKFKVKRENGEIVDMPTWLHESFTDSVVLIKGDSIVWECYLNSMTADSTHQMMSVTKSFAGLFGLMAAAEWLISEDDPVTKYDEFNINAFDSIIGYLTR